MTCEVLTGSDDFTELVVKTIKITKEKAIKECQSQLFQKSLFLLSTTCQLVIDASLQHLMTGFLTPLPLAPILSNAILAGENFTMI